MSTTPTTALSGNFSAAGARTGEYCGAETALSFSDSRAEFAALVHGCALYDLGWRARFRISGKDRVRWLNGMVSNNIRELPPHRGNYNFVLNAQGRIQGDLHIYNLGDYFLASTERFQVDHLLTLLRRYIIMDQVELTDIGGEVTGVAVQGPDAAAVLGKAGFYGPLPQPAEMIELAWRGKTFFATRAEDERFQTYELWLPPQDAPGVWDALLAAGATPVGTGALEMFRIAAGIPRYGADIRDRDLPQETGQMHALSFTKGCYVGQEIVERIRSRGHVHRTFAGLAVDGLPPAPGAKIHVAEREAGEVTSAAVVPLPGAGRDRTCALGYLRREFAAPGVVVEVAGVRATVSLLPFPEILARVPVSDSGSLSWSELSNAK